MKKSVLTFAVIISSIGVALFSWIFFSAKSHDNGEVIDFHSLSDVNYCEVLPRMDTIKLNDSGEYSISEIDKVILKHGDIYAADRRQGKIFRFNSCGDPVSILYRKGRGPQEYLNITDFDVAEDGIIIMDGQRDMILCYDEDGHFLYSTEMPFEAYAFSILSNGGFLFNLAPWNQGPGKGMKLAFTNKDLKSFKADVPYADVFDPDFSFPSVAFASSGSFIAFNQPIDDHVYVMDSTGTGIAKYRFEFGNSTVPVEYRKQIESHLEEIYNGCTFLANVVYSDGNIMIGTLKDRGVYRDFIVDLHSGTKAVQEKGESLRLRSVTGGYAIYQDLSESSFTLFAAPLSSFQSK